MNYHLFVNVSGLLMEFNTEANAEAKQKAK